MLVVSVMLLTLWLGAQLLQVGMGSLVHVFAAAALLIVFLRKAPRVRHA